MPERVVDVLEAVEVDEHQGCRCATALAQDRPPLGEEVGAVRQAGERVVGRVVGAGGRLATEPARGGGCDRQERQVQERQAGREDQVQPAGVGGEALAEGLVGHSQLGRSPDLRRLAEADGNDDLEDALAAARVLVGRRGADLALRLPVERSVDDRRHREDPVLQPVHRREDHTAVGAADVRVLDVLGAATLHGDREQRLAVGGDALGEVRRYEHGSDRDVRNHLGGLRRVADGARAHLTAELQDQDEPQQCHAQEAQQAEPQGQPESWRTGTHLLYVGGEGHELERHLGVGFAAAGTRARRR